MTDTECVRLVQAIRAQLQQAIGSGGEASTVAYSQAEEVPQDSERSIFENGAVNALYRLVHAGFCHACLEFEIAWILEHRTITQVSCLFLSPNRV